MGTVELILGIVIMAMSLFLVVSVLMQSGKDKSLSGTIAGGSDTYFGKSKTNTKDKILVKLTTIIASIFAILLIVFYVVLG